MGLRDGRVRANAKGTHERGSGGGVQSGRAAARIVRGGHHRQGVLGKSSQVKSSQSVLVVTRLVAKGTGSMTHRQGCGCYDTEATRFEIGFCEMAGSFSKLHRHEHHQPLKETAGTVSAGDRPFWGTDNYLWSKDLWYI